MPAIENKHYLYRHIRLDKNVPFYIGMGTKTRKKSPYNRANCIKDRNKIWDAIYGKTDIEIEILFESDDINFIIQKEKEFISLYGRLYNSTGTLANIDEGGYSTNKKRPPEYYQKRRENDIRQCLKMANEMIGKNHFYRNISIPVYAYNLSGELVGEYGSGVQAANEIGGNAKSYNILRKLDIGRSYEGFYFSKFRKQKLDVTGFVVCDTKDFSIKKVVKLNPDGSIDRKYNSIKEAALCVGLHPDRLGRVLRTGEGTRKGVFKYDKDFNG